MLKRFLRSESGVELAEYAIAAALMALLAVTSFNLLWRPFETMMFPPLTTAGLILLVPLTVLITYFDLRYRRIPNLLVLVTLIGGVAINISFNGWAGAKTSLLGCFMAFVFMFVLHIFGSMGAGDVKLFAAIGSLTGYALVLPMFLIVLLTGGVVAIISVVWTHKVETTMLKASLINAGKLMAGMILPPGRRVPYVTLGEGTKTSIPYGIAITFGSLITLTVFKI